MSCRKSQDWREGNGLGRSLAAAMDPAEGRLAVCFGRGGARGGERRMKGRPGCGRLPKRILRGATPIPCSDVQQKADVFSDGRSHTLLPIANTGPCREYSQACGATPLAEKLEKKPVAYFRREEPHPPEMPHAGKVMRLRSPSISCTAWRRRCRGRRQRPSCRACRPRSGGRRPGWRCAPDRGGG